MNKSEVPQYGGQEEKTLERKRGVLVNAMDMRFRNEMKEFREQNPEAKKREQMVAATHAIISRFERIIPEKLNEISELRDSLLALDRSDKEIFIQKASEMITDFLLSRYNFEELEALARRFGNDSYKNYTLNRLIEYGISGDVVHIHVPPTFVDNPRELVEMFVDAMKKLADRLQNDPDLANIQRVTARSWIVVRGQKALTKFGFRITAIDLEKDRGEAEISREELIERYYNK